MNLYAYCGNNPQNYVDPLGLKIEFGVDVSWLDRRAYEKAIKELSKTALFRNTYEYLKRYDTPLVTILIGTEYSSSHFPDPQFSIIYWNKEAKLKTYKGEQSPVIGLAHEMEHARIKMIGGISVPRNELGYKPKEENYIVKWFETPIARELGEPYRKDYLEPNRIEKNEKCKK